MICLSVSILSNTQTKAVFTSEAPKRLRSAKNI